MTPDPAEFDESHLPPSATEFDEARIISQPLDSVVYGTRLPAKLSKPRTMRLLVGLPIVYGVLAMYLGLITCVVTGLVTVAVAKELAGLISIPATLAATVVGFFFAKTATRK